MTTVATDEELDFLIQSFMKLTNTHIRDFLRTKDLPVSGTKEDLQTRIEEAITAGTIAVSDLVGQLDTILPWWSFHAFLLEGPRRVPDEWRDEQKVKQHLRKQGLHRLLNAVSPLVLPQELTLSTIDYTPTTLTVVAVQRRDYTAREHDLDEFGETQEGETVEYRAWVHRIARVMVILEWNLRTREATLRITVLPRGVTYEEVRDQFAELITDWLDLSIFSVVRIRKSISELHAAEEAGTAEARSHGIEYSTAQGRRLAGRSSTATESVLGEQVIDESLRRMRVAGIGRVGNFYWPPTFGGTNGAPSLGNEIHTIILGERDRINLRARAFTNNTEAEMRHVLSRLRALSR